MRLYSEKNLALVASGLPEAPKGGKQEEGTRGNDFKQHAEMNLFRSVTRRMNCCNLLHKTI